MAMDAVHISLTLGYVAIVDAADADRVLRYRWYASVGSGKPYARNSRVSGMHRLIVGALPGEHVDHINGNTLDNRRENLRICSHAENCRNRKINLGRRLKGFYESRGRFVARIRFNQRLINLGSFATEEEAARAYDAGAIRYFGAFANLNFPPPTPTAEIA